MLQSDLQTLWGLLSATGRLSDRFIRGVDTILCLSDLVAKSSLPGGAETVPRQVRSAGNAGSIQLGAGADRIGWNSGPDGVVPA